MERIYWFIKIKIIIKVYFILSLYINKVILNQYNLLN
jgi:hypothetical protein